MRSIFLLLLFAVSACNISPSDKEEKLPEDPAEQVPAKVKEEAHKKESVLPPIKHLVFAGDTVPLDNPEVRERLEYELISNKYRHSRTIIILKRINRWRPMIDSVLENRNIPKDFIYMAVAESELDNDARSHAGAVGMWQFMQGTGKEYGLNNDRHVDERKHPLKSTRAAARYLTNAYKKFENWSLVASSYNMGMSGVQRAMDNQESDNYYDLYLNPETSRYVFRILAFKIILENPEAFGFNIPEDELYQPWEITTDTVDNTISDLNEYAASKGLNYNLLRYYNPWLDDYRQCRLRLGRKETAVFWLPKKEE